MRNTLSLIALSVFAVSCSTQKTSATPQKPPIQVEEKKETAVKAEPVPGKIVKPQIQHQGDLDFFKINIADAAKNDNTISHGSIVSAKAAGYKISKEYFPAVGQNFRQRYIILHYTALDYDKSVRVLTEQSVSSHYLIGDQNDKIIHQLVDENKRAYHSGLSHWRGVENLNDSSVGIEIVNTGFTNGATGQREFYPYPEWQFRKVGALVKDLVDRYMILPENVLGHSDVAPTRKQDPGPLFPWKRLYEEYGVGMWYDQQVMESYMNQMDAENFYMQSTDPTFIFKYQTMLKQFGYGLNPSGSEDPDTKKTIEAFQYRFRPEKATGSMDVETYAILQALLDKYPGK